MIAYTMNTAYDRRLERSEVAKLLQDLNEEAVAEVTNVIGVLTDRWATSPDVSLLRRWAWSWWLTSQ
jgi:hypothetical protein